MNKYFVIHRRHRKSDNWVEENHMFDTKKEAKKVERKKTNGKKNGKKKPKPKKKNIYGD